MTAPSNVTAYLLAISIIMGYNKHVVKVNVSVKIGVADG